MIPAKDGYVAAFNPGTSDYRAHPVVAWNDEGEPLIVGDTGLVRAWNLPGFHGVVQRPESTVVSAVPGGGWLIDCVDQDGDTWTDVIVAWSVHADGSMAPLGTDREGVTSDATEGLADYRIYHPDSSLAATDDSVPAHDTA